MDDTYNEFEGTDLDPSVDYDWEDEEGNDLLPIIGASAAVAAVAGGLLVLAGRRRNPTPQERVEDVIEEVQKRGKKGAKIVGHAIEDAHLGDLLSDAVDKARSLSGSAVEAVQDARLNNLLDDALTRTRKAATRLDIMETVGDVTKDTRKGLRKQLKKARHNLEDLHLDAMAGDAVKKARHAADGFDVGDTVSAIRKRAEGAVDSVRDLDLSGGNASSILDTVKEKLAEAFDAVRDDLAPKAIDAVQHAAGTVGHTVREDVLPAAQEAAEHVRDDVLPDVGERVSHMVEDAELDKKARKLASSARSGAGSLGELGRTLAMAVLHKVMDEALPEAKKAGRKAAQTARDEVGPAAAHMLKDDVLPRMEDAATYTRHRAADAATFARHRAGEVASQAPDVLGDLLKMARERVDEVLNKAEPAASDAVEATKARLMDMAGSARNGAGGVGSSVAGRAGDAAEYTRHRASDAATFAKHRASGVAGGLRQGKDNVTGAVGTAAGATVSATREMTGILFWLSMLGGLILLVFIPDRERQKEIWNSILQFIGELREMWRDMQGSDFDDLPEGDTGK
jgi:hypothetical protein